MSARRVQRGMTDTRGHLQMVVRVPPALPPKPAEPAVEQAASSNTQAPRGPSAWGFECFLQVPREPPRAAPSMFAMRNTVCKHSSLRHDAAFKCVSSIAYSASSPAAGIAGVPHRRRAFTLCRHPCGASCECQSALLPVQDGDCRWSMGPMYNMQNLDFLSHFFIQVCPVFLTSRLSLVRPRPPADTCVSRADCSAANQCAVRHIDQAHVECRST